MRIYGLGKDIIPKKPRAIALGLFDGMHLGHRALLESTARAAEEKNLGFAVFTFSSEGKIKSGTARLERTEDKLSKMEELGVGEVFVAEFSDIANLTPEQFVRQILVSELDCRLGAVGYNFRFGKGASGDAELFSTLLKASGGEALVLGEVSLLGEAVSSTRIRRALSRGEPSEAFALLGEPYSVEALVERGLGLGKSFGFPTVNTPLDFDCPLKRGVYRTVVELGGRLYTGVTNVGLCPTVGERELHAETFIVDFSGEIYGEKIKTYFLEYLREEKKFDNVSALSEQIRIDAKRAKEGNGESLWQAIGRS